VSSGSAPVLEAPPGDPGWAKEPDVLGGELRPLAGHVVFTEDPPAGHTGSQAPQPAHSPGVDVNHPLAFAVQPAGHSPAQVLSLTSMYGAVITYVMGGPTSPR
jgi:hypothetical protein